MTRVYDEEAPPCPVHPYGYHHSPRLHPRGRQSVFRHHSPIGLPARCPQLEDELHAADREEEFLDELWIRERATRGHGLAMLGAAVVAAVVTVLILMGAAVGVEVAVIVMGVVVIAGLSRVDVRIQRERLRRIRDWHRRVGVPR
ncbi:hypothetical protein [Demequina pelophila]|uniref:hypothetical protein n=1 Tax=Demequina pelophila TaxID=1638984 RepID=UPI0007809DBC|nr:hypothetical protein [Demequina pelophila]